MVMSPIRSCFIVFSRFFGTVAGGGSAFKIAARSSAPQARSLMAGARDIFGIAAAIAMDAVGRQLQHAIGERSQEMAVVRHEQHVLGGEVEVVGWLVEHEEIRWIVEHFRHHEARLLAARQHPASLLDIVAGKSEAAGERSQRALTGLRKSVLQRLK